MCGVSINISEMPFLLQHVWVMPNSSARCAQLPRAVDKVPFYSGLKKFRDYLRGTVSSIEENEMVFKEVKLQNFKNIKRTLIKTIMTTFKVVILLMVTYNSANGMYLWYKVLLKAKQKMIISLRLVNKI